MKMPIRAGTALAATIAVAYAACTLVFWLFPHSAAGFMKALFHGIDVTAYGGGAFTFDGFAYALIVLSAWVFLMGVLFSWISGRLRS